MRCILLGDKGCGKSSLALTFLLGRCPESVNDDSFSSYTKYFDGVKVEVLVSCNVNFDNPDQCQQFFKDIDAVLLCFAVDDPSSFESVQQYWFHVVREHASHAHFYLVGCKMDTLPYSELPAGTVLLTPSLMLRSPTITSIKNAINGTKSKSPAPNPASPDPRGPPSREVTETSSLTPPREESMVRDARCVATSREHVITRDLGRNLAAQLGCVEYLECTVKEEFSGPNQVASIFTKVVNKTRTKSRHVSGASNSQVCVIL